MVEQQFSVEDLNDFFAAYSRQRAPGGIGEREPTEDDIDIAKSILGR